MLTIHRYELRMMDSQLLNMPRGALLLSVGVKGGDATESLWAAVDSEEPLVERRVFVVGTGHSMEAAAEAEFVGTAIDYLRGLVWHVFVEAV